MNDLDAVPSHAQRDDPHAAVDQRLQLARPWQRLDEVVAADQTARGLVPVCVLPRVAADGVGAERAALVLGRVLAVGGISADDVARLAARHESAAIECSTTRRTSSALNLNTGITCSFFLVARCARRLRFVGINPLGNPDQLGQAQDLLGHPPGVVLGQALGEVPARRLVVEIDVGEDAASGVPDLERLALLLDFPRLGKGSTVADLHHWQCPRMTVPSRLCAISVPSTRLMKPCQTAVGSRKRFCNMLPSVGAISKNKCLSVTWTAKLLPNVQECIVFSSRSTVTCSFM